MAPIFLGIAFAVVATLIYLFFPESDYKSNIVVEVAGLAVVILIVDNIYAHLSARNDRDKEKVKIKQVNVLLSVYLGHYREALFNMLSNPPSFIMDKKDQLSVKHLANIYNDYPVKGGPTLLPSFEIYFDELNKLLEALRHFILILDPKMSDGLIELFQDFVRLNDTNILYRAISERAKDKVIVEADQQQLREVDNNNIVAVRKHKFAAEIEVYISLFETLEKNLEFIERYEREVSKHVG